MNANRTEAYAKYRDGLDELLFVHRVFGNIARAMGTPVWDDTQSTAYVTFDGDSGKIMFAFNPDFILTLSTEEVAAVLGHETYHVALDHLPEMLSGAYPDAQALRKAHECIINDTVDNVLQLPLPDIGVWRGPDLCGQDCSNMSTRMAYDIFSQDENKTPEPDPDCPQHGDKSQDKDDKSEDQDKSDSEDQDTDDKNDGDQDSDKDESGDEDGDQDGKGEDSDEDSDDGADGDEDSEKGDGDQDGDGDGGDEDSDSGDGDSGADGSGGEGNAPGDGAGDDGDADSAHGHGPSGPPCTCPKGGAGQGDGGCKGVVIPDGMSQEAKDAIQDVLDQAAQDMGMTPDELQDAIQNATGGVYSPTGVSIFEKTEITKERMNWKLLLAKINPKVMESGRVRLRTRNNWTTYNRRMGSVYPKAIIPKTERVKPKPKDKGDALPVLVVALDLSGSIDRALVKMLQGLLNEIPTELIKAYPCTWGSNLIPYVEGGYVAGASGTNIHLVADYVKKVKEESGTDPYVLVITDGQFTNKHERPGRDWFFMSVDKASIPTFTKVNNNSYYGSMGGHVASHEEVYLVDDFRV